MTLADLVSILAVAGLAFVLVWFVDTADRVQEDAHRDLMRRLRKPEAGQ